MPGVRDELDLGVSAAGEHQGVVLGDVHVIGAFLFPQMTFVPPGETKTIAESENWRPHFVDYLFVAFNTSTAFSPTDAPVLTIWAKGAMMIQSIISFTTVVLTAADAAQDNNNATLATCLNSIIEGLRVAGVFEKITGSP